MEGDLAGGGAGGPAAADLCSAATAPRRPPHPSAAPSSPPARSPSAASRTEKSSTLSGDSRQAWQKLCPQLKKESKCKLIRESISNASATNEQLRGLLLEKRARRDEFASVIAHQLQAVEALEANIDVTGKKNLEEAIVWYNKFLGFRVVAGEEVKFVFNFVEMQSPDDEYSFCIKVNNDEYSLTKCIPLLKDTEELVKDLNCTDISSSLLES